MVKNTFKQENQQRSFRTWERKNSLLNVWLSLLRYQEVSEVTNGRKIELVQVGGGKSLQTKKKSWSEKP
jgi:hypothetical protein